MNILVIDRFFGGRDGPGIYIHDLVAGLLKRGHRVGLAYDLHKGDYAPAGLEPLHVPGLSGLIGSPRARRRMGEVLAQFQPDVASAQCLDVLWFAEQVSRVCPILAAFHTHAVSCPNWTRLYQSDRTLCTRDFGPACAWHTVADGCGDKKPHAIAANFLRVAGARHMLRHVDGAQAVTPYMREMLERTHLLDGEQLFDLPYPAPFFDAARVYTPPPGRARILFVGRLHEGKGPQLLVEAAARMKVAAELLFVGDGPDEQALRARARELGVSERCRFIVGRETVVTRGELSQLYLDANVVAVPSIWGDPAPLVRLETMAHGRPLVGFDAGGVSSCIEHGVTGFVVPRLDVGELAARLDEVAGDPALAEKMGRAALRRTHEKYHPDSLAAEVESIYQRFIDRRSAAG
jgi:glycosyltransferase involved in cell wall biosynthesis